MQPETIAQMNIHTLMYIPGLMRVISMFEGICMTRARQAISVCPKKKG